MLSARLASSAQSVTHRSHKQGNIFRQIQRYSFRQQYPSISEEGIEKLIDHSNRQVLGGLVDGATEGTLFGAILGNVIGCVMYAREKNPIGKLRDFTSIYMFLGSVLGTGLGATITTLKQIPKSLRTIKEIHKAFPRHP